MKKLAILLAAMAPFGASYADLAYMSLPFDLTCGPTPEVYEHGYKEYGEVPSFMATSDKGRRIVWALNEDASAMSLIVSDPDGTSCVVWSTYCPPGECLSPAINFTENDYDRGL
jgi:hypothetical protein